MKSNNSNGYVLVKVGSHPVADKKGRALEHRYLWHEAHGPIPDGMVVHHKNGKKDDNRIENLELVTRSQHMKEHYPEGFWFKPHNKGMTEYLILKCAVCSIHFLRKASYEKMLARGRANASVSCCSIPCSSSLGYPARALKGD